MPEEFSGFTADSGSGVSIDTAATETSSPATAVDGVESSGQETPAATGDGRTPEPRLIPETDLNNLRSTMDRKMADLQRQYEQQQNQAQQVIENLTRAMLEQRWQQMPYEEAEAERAQYTAAQARQQMEAQQAAIAAQREQLNREAAPIFANKLAAQYGLDAKEAESLLKFPDPQTMSAHAQELAMVKARYSLNERKASGVDRMDGGGNAGGPAWDGKRGRDLLGWYYANAAKQAPKVRGR